MSLKAQAALLEATEEGQVTVDDEIHQLPSPLFVIVMQNLVEQEGTFTLLEVQVDRFVVESAVSYPDLDGEVGLLHRRAGRSDQSLSVERVLDRDAVAVIRRAPESVCVGDDLLEYTVKLVRETRTDRRIRIDVFPHGTQRLFEATRVRAIIRGREFVTSDDVRRVAQSVLAHRLVLTLDTRVKDVQKLGVVDDVFGRVTMPALE